MGKTIKSFTYKINNFDQWFCLKEGKGIDETQFNNLFIIQYLVQY